MKVIKIGAVWCNTCLVMKPRWEEIEKENPWLETEFLDFDNDAEKVKRFGLAEERIPAFIFLDKNGEEIERLFGEISKEDLIKKVNELKGK